MRSFPEIWKSAPALCALLITLAGCAHGTAGGTAGGRHHRGAGAATPVALCTATVGSIHPALSIAGIIAPFQNVAVTSILNEPADQVAVIQGAQVRAGQLLALFDTQDLRAQLLSAQGSLANAQAAAASAKSRYSEAKFTGPVTFASGSNGLRSAQDAQRQAAATLHNDELNLARDRTLQTQGYIPQQTLDQQQTLVLQDEAALQTAIANVRIAASTNAANGNAQSGLPAATIAAAQTDYQAAAAAVTTAQGQVNNLASSISKATITSPVDGVVVNRNLNAGEYPGGRTLFTVQELDRVYLNLNASSSNVFTIPTGTPVTVSVGGTKRLFYGRVNAVLGQVSPGSTNFTVQAIVPNPGLTLQAGMAATGKLGLPAVEGVAIPVTAFLDDTHGAVMRVDITNGRRIAHQTTVVEKANDGKTSIITGLASNARLVTNGQLGITDGQDITPPTPAPSASAGAPADASADPQASPRHHRHRTVDSQE